MSSSNAFLTTHKLFFCLAASVVLTAVGCGDDTTPVDECTPVCVGGQECGSDGCGGFCGTDDGMCTDGLSCDGFACVENPCPDGFVLMPAWTFMMGSPTNEPGRQTGGGDETLHEVTISKPFCMATTEVTNALWTDVTGTTPSYFATAGDDLPIQNVSWYDAIKFLNMKSTAEGLVPCYGTTGETGTHGSGCVEGQIQCDSDFRFESVTRVDNCNGYRLPTEAEWELAARAGYNTDPKTFEGRAESVGLQCQTPNSRLDPFAWFCGNAAATYETAYDCRDWSPLETCGPQPVGTKDPNEWGLYDMLGNVFEFCQDHYWMYESGAASEPGPDPVFDSVTGANRIMRGGSWSATAAYARVASRAAMKPTDRGDCGLRMVIDVPSYAGSAVRKGLTRRTGETDENGTGITEEEQSEQDVIYDGPTYRVVSFNVLCSVCDNSFDPWDKRLDYFREVFDTIQPDLVGLQEITFDFEVDQVLEKMPGFAAYYYPGDDGDLFPYPDAAVFYKTERFTLLDSGEYWLSPTPDIGWSLGFSPGQTLPRVASWVKLHDKTYDIDIYFMTTHFDSTHPHQENSAPMLVSTLKDRAATTPVIVTGDFNTQPHEPAFNILTNGIDATGFHLDDAFETVGNVWDRDFNTDIAPAYDPINRIDHIFTAGGQFTTKWWWVDLRKFGEEIKYPSDHRLIWAEIVLEQ